MLPSNISSVKLKIEPRNSCSASFLSSSSPHPSLLKTVKKSFGLGALIAGGVMCLCLDPCWVTSTENSVSGHPWPHVPAGHPLPRHHQCLQQRPIQRPLVSLQQAQRDRQVHDDLHLHDFQRDL